PPSPPLFPYTTLFRSLEAIVKLRALRVFTQLPGRQGVEGEVGEQQHENSREDPAWRQKSSKAALRLLAALWIDRHRSFLPSGLPAAGKEPNSKGLALRETTLARPPRRSRNTTPRQDARPATGTPAKPPRNDVKCA